ncbi:hypothetical protein ACQUQP_13790 [Marinobacterium sp. YM272]|uniref:hypothetical protein n=1 Tax=Marinobacterium sp. YM272 TaxID=3421654 RepID=UPI003D7F5701
MFDITASKPVAYRDNAKGTYMLEVPDTPMSLSHRVSPGRGFKSVMACSWFNGVIAVTPARLVASSNGLVVIDLSRPHQGSGFLSLELPTPGCLEVHLDGTHCTDHLKGYWELRIYTGRAEEIARMFGPA